MKRALPIFLFCLISLISQSQHLPKVMDDIQIVPMLPQPSPSPILGSAMPSSNAAPINFRNEEIQIGLTYFETQSIGSMGRRIATFPDGTISAAWLHGLDQNGGWPDRGTAYNQSDGTNWDGIPDFSLEATRSGYPSFTNTPNGLEVVISHKNTTATQWYLQAHTKMPDETDWTEMEIPSTVPGGPVWAKVATGGSDGNSIHVVAVSVDPEFGGVTYEGINQHPLYYRSTDAGVTWDKVDVIIPGLDSNYYSSVAGEAYNIYANGETIAIGVFDAWGDIAVFKSIDNGETWTKFIVKDHPLDKYDGSGYGSGDVPFDPLVPDSISIFSSDYSGSVLVDDDGKVHVFYGAMYVYANGADRFLNVQFTDNTLVFDGIAYWNEKFETDQVEIIATALDMDGDSVVTASDFGDIRYNNTNFTSFPTSSIDDEGNIYVVYTSVREDLPSVDNITLRHVFIVKSSDGGQTWSEPFDLINEDVVEFFNFIEAQYPSIPSRIGDRIELIYMQDFAAGLTPENTIVPEQNIMHVSYDKETFETTYAGEIRQLKSNLKLSPNPALDGISVQFDLPESMNVSFRIFDTLGKQYYLSKKENLPAGKNSEWLNIIGIPNGLYFVQMEADGAQASRKLVVGK